MLQHLYTQHGFVAAVSLEPWHGEGHACPGIFQVAGFPSAGTPSFQPQRRLNTSFVFMLGFCIPPFHRR